MRTRRVLVVLAATFTLLALAAGCKSGSSSSSSATESPPKWPRTTTHEGVEMIELFPQGATETSPLIVAIHGMGDRPDRWVAEWSQFPAKVHIVLPRAFDAHGGGWSWFTFRDGMTDEQFGAEVGGSETRLWKGIAHVAGSRKPIITGFSQGGILSFAIAARHPDAITHAFPVAGSCPGPILPQNKAKAAPILAFHGTTDRVLEIKWGREAINAFKEQGNIAELREYEGVGHTMTPQMKKDVWDAIVKALPPR